MAQTLARYGLDARAMFEAVGLDPAAFGTADSRVASVAMQQLWRNAVAESGDDAFGLAYAETMHPAVLEGLGFAWIASSTLRDAFERLVRFYRFIVTAGEIVLEEAGDELRLCYRTPGPAGAAAPASLDAALAIFVQLGRFTKDPHFKPIRVESQRSQPADTLKFDTFFGCPVEFGREENVVVFDSTSLDEPLPTGNPELARANDQVVIDYLGRHDQESIVSQVRAAIIDWLPSGAPSQERIAEAVHMSSRSLQRKLSAAGLTYKALLDDLRKEIAQQYLAGSGRSISEIAYLLGFSEPGNFARSFKRWTGQTPQEYQNACSSQA
jgi:AraC-like DNA-binding protein